MAELERIEVADMKFLSSIAAQRIWNARVEEASPRKEQVARD
jgi:hypothetical protein